MKKIISIILATILIATFCTAGYTAMPDTLEPMWDNIGTVSHNLYVNRSIGTAAMDVSANTGATEISATLTVYKQIMSNWVFVGQDSDTTSNENLSLRVDFPTRLYQYYKSELVVSVTRNGVTETETFTIYDTCRSQDEN